MKGPCHLNHSTQQLPRYLLQGHALYPAMLGLVLWRHQELHPDLLVAKDVESLCNGTGPRRLSLLRQGMTRVRCPNLLKIIQ